MTTINLWKALKERTLHEDLKSWDRTQGLPVEDSDFFHEPLSKEDWLYLESVLCNGYYTLLGIAHHGTIASRRVYALYLHYSSFRRYDPCHPNYQQGVHDLLTTVLPIINDMEFWTALFEKELNQFELSYFSTIKDPYWSEVFPKNLDILEYSHSLSTDDMHDVIIKIMKLHRDNKSLQNDDAFSICNSDNKKIAAFFYTAFYLSEMYIHTRQEEVKNSILKMMSVDTLSMSHEECEIMKEELYTDKSYVFLHMLLGNPLPDVDMSHFQEQQFFLDISNGMPSLKDWLHFHYQKLIVAPLETEIFIP